jgi:hypothetical protein
MTTTVSASQSDDEYFDECVAEEQEDDDDVDDDPRTAMNLKFHAEVFEQAMAQWKREHDVAGFLVGSIDQGTSSTRFLLFSKSGQIVISAQREHRQIYPSGPDQVGSVALVAMAHWSFAGPGLNHNSRQSNVLVIFSRDSANRFVSRRLVGMNTIPLKFGKAP